MGGLVSGLGVGKGAGALQEQREAGAGRLSDWQAFRVQELGV